MDRYDTYTDKFLHDTQYNILGTNLAEVGTDTISRQQAIDALNEYFVRIGKLKRRGLNKGEKAIRLDTVGAINSLPHAQHIDADGTLWITVPDIEQVTRVIVDEEKSKFCRQFYMDAQPERTGKWIPVDSYTAYGGDEVTWMVHGNPVAFYYCSECKEHAYAGEDGDDILSKFCPYCGAKMVEVNNETD